MRKSASLLVLQFQGLLTSGSFALKLLPYIVETAIFQSFIKKKYQATEGEERRGRGGKREGRDAGVGTLKIYLSAAH